MSLDIARKMEILVATIRHEYETAESHEVAEILGVLLEQTTTACNKIRGLQATGSNWEWAVRYSVLVPQGEGEQTLGTVPA